MTAHNLASQAATAFSRPHQWSRLDAWRDQGFDLIVIGGGASGLGVAVDAALRGYRVALFEAQDFAKGTSSRATKLVHGGVRYLAQGHVSLVREALRERRALLDHAPHLAQPLRFVVPTYHRWETPFYGLGLMAYEAMAGASSLGSTQWLNAPDTVRALPGVKQAGLRGGVAYWDGQFDDARLALCLAQTAAQWGAVVLNHAPVQQLLHNAAGQVEGVVVHDSLTGREPMPLRAHCIVNATGVWVDEVLAMDRPSPSKGPAPDRLVSPSQGVHLVVDRDFLAGDQALMVPKTSDGRVLFAVPWLGKLILGTTDEARADMPLEPRPMAHEVNFILGEAARYLRRAPTASDVRSAWAGLRPLVRPQSLASTQGGPSNTKAMSREHTVLSGASGLVTVTGGKWTTYRAMAEDVLAQCLRSGRLPARPIQQSGPGPATGRTSNGQDGISSTRELRLAHAPWATEHGQARINLAAPPGLHGYGLAATEVAALAGADHWLWSLDDDAQPARRGGLSEAMVRYAVSHEMAGTVEDVLARRSRLLFLDARAAMDLAGPVAAPMQRAGAPPAGTSTQAVEAFRRLAQAYLLPGV